jgi:hypothetical protein
LHRYGLDRFLRDWDEVLAAETGRHLATRPLAAATSERS